MKTWFFFGCCCILLPLFTCAQPQHDQAKLAEMIAFNEKNKSDRLVVSIKDTLLADVTFSGKPNDVHRIYSITKVFSALAIGALIDAQKIPHPETLVADYFPEWKADSLKSKITVRHLLHHSSGLAAMKGGRELEGQNDFVQFALNSPVISPPGHVFFYNNKAINIISGMVSKITGQSLEQFIREKFFEPLEIKHYKWESDAAGNTLAMDGLWMEAGDLLKIGQLLSNMGEWKGKRLLSTQWCAFMFQIPLANTMNGLYGYAASIRSLPYGDQLALNKSPIDTLTQLGLPPETAVKLSSLLTQKTYTYKELGSVLKAQFTAHEMEAITALASKNLLCLYAEANQLYFIKHGGEFGLLLAAFPKSQKVMVRYIGEKWGRKTNKDGTYTYFIEDDNIIFLQRL